MKIYGSAREALSCLKNGDKIFIQGASATPKSLINGLLEVLPSLSNIELMHLHTDGPAAYSSVERFPNLKITSFFVGSNIRKHIDYNRVDYLPCFLSEIPTLLREGPRKPNVAFVNISPPCRNGYCTLGTSVDVTLAALESAELVIAQINKSMPKVHGDGFIHISQIDRAIEVDEPLYELQIPTITDVERKIGKNCASLIEDGSCLQTGIGSIPNAVLAELKNHKNLGVHTEMWSDGVLDLIECGSINNSNKNVHRGKTVSTFIMGTKRVYDFLDDNPSVIQVGADYINNPRTIARNPKAVAINSAVEVDLTGQVCADSIGPHIISGVGGQLDFMRGASLSEGGKPIMAISSRTKSGKPKIVPTLMCGAGVVTTRNHIHYIVTEFGIANLFGKTMGERAKALIAIAHPDDRESLARDWHNTYCRLAARE